jgi:hypothetical protein
MRAFLGHGRRSNVRRASDRRRIILLDRYGNAMLAPIVLILVLSITDAVLTLFLLDHGAVELNPVMAYFLEKGRLSFIVAKYLLTAGALLVVVMLNYAFIPFLKLCMRDLLSLFSALFAAVIGWQIYLVIRYVL